MNGLLEGAGVLSHWGFLEGIPLSQARVNIFSSLPPQVFNHGDRRDQLIHLGRIGSIQVSITNAGVVGKGDHGPWHRALLRAGRDYKTHCNGKDFLPDLLFLYVCELQTYTQDAYEKERLTES